MLIFLLFKLIHVIAVTLFLGNIIIGLYWMRLAVSSKNLSTISHTMKGIIQADRWFTIPGVIIITAGGILAAIHGHYPLLRTGWIFWSLVMFTFSGIVFSWKLVPLQQKIYRMARDVQPGAQENFPWKEFYSQYQLWKWWGAAAFITPLAAMAMMILKVPATTFFFE